MPERKTVGQLMEEMRLKAGAQNYHGHDYMDLERFAEDTRHMIIFDVLTYVLDKSRLSIRLVPPYSEERKAAAREYAKEHGFQVVGAEEKIA